MYEGCTQGFLYCLPHCCHSLVLVFPWKQVGCWAVSCAGSCWVCSERKIHVESAGSGIGLPKPPKQKAHFQRGAIWRCWPSPKTDFWFPVLEPVYTTILLPICILCALWDLLLCHANSVFGDFQIFRNRLRSFQTLCTKRSLLPPSTPSLWISLYQAMTFQPVTPCASCSLASCPGSLLRASHML